jgi:RimJ/RimL family protein N-acetyltransferase
MTNEEQKRLLPIISGVILRRFKVEDAVPLADIEYDPVVKKYMAIPKLQKQAWVASFPKGMERNVMFAIVARPEGTLAGRATICATDGDGKRELQIVIGRAFWGRRFGRLVAQVLIPLAFDVLKAPSVTGIVHPENKPSIAILESWHFRRVGTHTNQDWQEGHLIYELGEDDYNNSRESQ